MSNAEIRKGRGMRWKIRVKRAEEKRNLACPLCHSPERFTDEEVAIFQALMAREETRDE